MQELLEPSPRLGIAHDDHVIGVDLRVGVFDVEEHVVRGDAEVPAHLQTIALRLAVRVELRDRADGRQRPLGVAALEDKIVQQAVVTILNQIYEVDFKGFSYGFRPGRSPHQALDALSVGIHRKRVNWVLDADIRGFLDPVSYCPLLNEKVSAADQSL